MRVSFLQTTQQSKVERLAALSFWQWQSWTRFFLEGKHTPEDLKEWVRLLGAKYEDLTGKQKENYRFWARKMLEIVESGE
jgi:hypothetical protein